jgi:hypothetical protein
MNTALIEKRKSELENFVKESFPVSVDFAGRLGLSNPHEILMDFNCLKNFIFSTVNDFMKSQTIEPDDRVWIITRIGYLLGEYFKGKYSGYWAVNENKDSVQYGHYVIFAASPTANVTYPIDVLGAAATFVDQHPERNLVNLIKEIEEAIK